MNDLFEIVEDLQQLEDYSDTPAFEEMLSSIKEKWAAELAKAEQELERQYEMFHNEFVGS